MNSIFDVEVRRVKRLIQRVYGKGKRFFKAPGLGKLSEKFRQILKIKK